MAFDLSTLNSFTDEVSFELISEAVLGSTFVENYVQLRPGFSAGTVAINILSGDIEVSDASCGFAVGGTSSFSQVDLTIVDKQIKESYCPEDLRTVWLSSQIAASGKLEEIPFADTIAALKIKKIKEYVEKTLIQGEGSIVGLIPTLTVAKGANAQVGATAAAWTPANAIAQAQAMVNGLNPEILDRDDLIAYMSYASFRALNQAMVNANLFHYAPGVDAGKVNMSLVIPGTNVLAVPFKGFGTSNRVIVGPKEYIVVGVGLTGDYDTFDIFYDKFNDVVKAMAKFRLGIAVAFPEYYTSNDLA